MKMSSAVPSLLFALFLCPNAEAQTFRCGDQVVSSGDTKAEVVMKCGSPSGADSRQEELIERLDPDTKRKIIVMIDEWTYIQGPDALTRILTFRNGRLSDVRESGYGEAVPASSPSQCDAHYPDTGATKTEVRAECGEPSFIDTGSEEILAALDANTKRKVTVATEEWTYNFGPSKFIRIFKFRNGRLADVRTGGYGN